MRAGILSGAFLRELSEWQPVVFTFVVAVLGMLALCAGVSGVGAMRGMTSMRTSSIATALPGYVELTGTLHAMPNAPPVIGPQSRQNGVWYETSTNSASKGLRRVRAAADGRQLLVSNVDEKQLIFMERVWFWLGVMVFLTAAIVLAWAYYQRYHVAVEPSIRRSNMGVEAER